MSKWKKLQKELIEKSISGEKSDILQEDLHQGKIYGTTFYKKGTNPRRGILIVHGIGGNRYCQAEFAKRLAEYGFFVLNIDIPSHFLNPNAFTLGELSETIGGGIILLKRYGMTRVSVIAHSAGAVGALFSSVGYNTQIENEIYKLWEGIVKLIEELGILTKKGESDKRKYMFISQEIEKKYTELKQLILYSLESVIKQRGIANCYIFLALPLNAKKAVPNIRLLRKLKHKWVK